MTALKFEKLAEVKANYDVLIKRLKPDQHADKIELMKSKKENALKKVQEEIDLEKKTKIAKIKETIEAKKRELQLAKDSSLEILQSQEHSRRKTIRLNITLNKQSSRGLLQTSGSSSTADISATNLNIKSSKV